ncbi:hypothetical protein [Aquimarina agarivorans]|uniref:hypothetical protein n=1 Tax=Aquimarina agarivorans TaxID=980584 RepID=UPI000248EA3C|nr:hypothetical protein [Aquimarina agarivorans]
MRIHFTIILVISFIISAVAQTDQEILEKKDNTIKGQFEELLKSSNNYKDFKVIKRQSFIILKKNTLDSLKGIEKELSVAQSKITELKKQIDITKTSLTSTNEKLETATTEIDSISVLGQQITKQSFKSITGGIFIGLLALLAFFIFKFRRSNTVTKNAIASLNDVEKEFEDHRRRALEREQVVMRKLQDEINKHK